MVQETSIELLPALPGTGNSSLAIVATFRALDTNGPATDGTTKQLNIGATIC
jgi:hypothetical protein